MCINDDSPAEERLMVTGSCVNYSCQLTASAVELGARLLIFTDNSTESYRIGR